VLEEAKKGDVIKGSFDRFVIDPTTDSADKVLERFNIIATRIQSIQSIPMTLFEYNTIQFDIAEQIAKWDRDLSSNPANK
jgi:hypothetical protein